MTVVKSTRQRVFELRVNVTGYLPGELKDWPSHIQDQIYAAMERVFKQTGVRKLNILRSRCGRDVLEEPYYVIVTVATPSEIKVLQ